MIEWLDKIDTQLFLLLNGLHSPFWDKIMWFASGKLSWLPLYILLLFFIYRKIGLKTWFALLLIILLITLSDQSSVHFFKNVFERFRPCHDPEISHLVHLVNNKCGGKFGFVSSHASNSFALAMFIALFFKKRSYTVFIFFWAALVSYSRIYLGRHYPGDIIGGMLLGIIIGLGVYHLFTFLYLKTFGKNSLELLKTP